MFQLTALQMNEAANAPKNARFNGQGLNIAGFRAYPNNNMPFGAAHEEPRHKSITTPSFSAAIAGASKEL